MSTIPHTEEGLCPVVGVTAGYLAVAASAILANCGDAGDGIFLGAADGRVAAGNALTAKRTSVDSIVMFPHFSVGCGKNPVAPPVSGGVARSSSRPGPSDGVLAAPLV